MRFQEVLFAMPMYEYACQDCGREFEAFVRSDTVPECPACHATTLDKRLSTFATHVAGAAAGQWIRERLSP